MNAEPPDRNRDDCPRRTAGETRRAAPRKQDRPLDTPIALYRLAGQFVAVFAAGILVKLLIITVVTVRGGQMHPAVLDGDWILVRRGIAAPSLAFGRAPGRGDVVVLDVPHRRGARMCLRVVARSGDSVAISHGRLLSPPGCGACVSAPDSALPPEYAPRDFFAPLRLPRPGDVFVLDSLSQRDFLFAASLQAQQDPRAVYDVKADLLIDGIPSNEYIVRNFLLYSGAFGSIPDSLDFDWFFWDRLRDNLRYTLENRSVRLQWTLYCNGRPIKTVKVKRACVFVLADDWVGGTDSRHFGPVCVRNIYGLGWRVLWSAGTDEQGRKRVRWERMLAGLRCAPGTQKPDDRAQQG